MRNIIKGEEPASLKAHRNTPGSDYSGLRKRDTQLQLLEEQGHICAYCMQRIEAREGARPNMIIEHIVPRNGPNGNSALELVYSNMLGTCIGKAGKIEYCGERKKDKLLKVLNPTTSDVESILEYTMNGLLVSSDDKATKDIELLNLNYGALSDKRAEIIEEIRDNLLEIEEEEQVKYLNNKLSEWKVKDNNQLIPFCQVAISFIQDTLSMLLIKDLSVQVETLIKRINNKCSRSRLRKDTGVQDGKEFYEKYFSIAIKLGIIEEQDVIKKIPQYYLSELGKIIKSKIS